MTADYAEMEREFLSYLEVDTGRDLPAWMAAIDDARLADRNAIIDWLRLRGFLFQRASWLERIYNNGGRPIYLPEVPASVTGVSPRSSPVDLPPTVIPPEAKRPPPDGAEPVSRPHLRLVVGAATDPVPGPSVRPAPPAELSLPHPRDIAAAALSAHSPSNPLPPLHPGVLAVVASAKAFAPLASHLVKVCREAVAGTSVVVDGDVLVLTGAGEGLRPYAMVQPSPRGVRLTLALSSLPVGPPFASAPKARTSSLPEEVARRFTHAIVLDDVRRIDSALIGFVKMAAHRP
ncbi:MAG: hypothetical protein NW217_03490 [Hyphomicrobiaceae bacterium]|nr:hypothetical protein [Hyphomicrobiaceae bacterium]